MSAPEIALQQSSCEADCLHTYGDPSLYLLRNLCMAGCGLKRFVGSVGLLATTLFETQRAVTPCEGFTNTTQAPCFCSGSQYSWLVWEFRGPSGYRIDADSIFQDYGGQHLVSPVDQYEVYCPDDSCYGFRILPPVQRQTLGNFFVCTNAQSVTAFAGCTTSEALAIGITNLWTLMHSGPGSHSLPHMP